MDLNKASLTLRAAILCLTFCQTVVSEPVTTRIIDYDTVRNAVFSSTEIILAGDKMLHLLKGDLTLQNETSVCGNCSNKILLLNSDETIILCHTQNGGKCEKRSIDNISAVPTFNYNFPDGEDITSQAVLTNDNHMLLGVVHTNVSYKIIKFTLNLQRDNKEIQIGSPTETSIHYMAAKVVQTQSFFFINEKPSEGSNYTSRMVVVCAGGVHQTVDLQCRNNSKHYNLIQDGTFLDLNNGDWLFVGTFRSADAVTDESGDSAICVQKFSLMTISASCTGTVNPVTMDAVYTWTSDREYLTTVSGHVVPNTNIMVIQIGTSAGRLIQFFTSSASLESFGDKLEPFSELLVQAGVPVVAIDLHQFTPDAQGTRKKRDTQDTSSGDMYVVTQNKIAIYSPPSCTLYKTCEETVESKNPYCGWCLLDGRSTSQSSCTSGDWISVFATCVSLEASPPAQKVDSSAATVTLTANSSFTMVGTFQCKIMSEEIPATTNGHKFTCTIPPAKDPTLTTLMLEGVKDNGDKYTVASTQFLYYKCAEFKKCGECINTTGVQCQWCSAQCQDSCPSNSGINQISNCPIVTTTSPQFLPNGIPKKVAIDVSIPDGEVGLQFACSVNDSTNTTFPGTFSSNQVSCDMELHIPVNESKQTFNVIVMYGQSPSTMAVIDGSTTVKAYRPEILAKDCTHCKFLNPTNYNCSWDGSRCAYNADGFSDTVQCPGAAVTGINPKDGNILGGTLVTIYVSNMVGNGSSVSVKLGSSDCSVKVLDVSEQPEFTNTIIDSIQCLSKAHGEVTIDVAVTIDGLSSDIMFSYKKPDIVAITPKQGIKAGGITVTFTGSNLMSGNKIVQIRYNRATLLNNCIVFSDSMITCVIRGNIFSDMQSIRAFFDGSIYNYMLTYTLLDNPNITNVSISKTIFSGGITMTISGDNFNNVGEFGLSANYNGFEKPTKCGKNNFTDTEISCQTPPAPASLKLDLDSKLAQNNLRRRKRSATCPCIEVVMKIQMDGFEREITLSYYPDPKFDNMTDVKKIEPDEEYIELTGDYLNLVAMVEDFVVHIGENLCTELALYDTKLICKVPKHEPDGSKHSVTVSVGNVRASLGSVQYGEVDRLKEIITIVISVLGVVIGIAVLVGAIFFVKYQLVKRQKKKLEKKLEDTEMEVRNIARQEFIEMANGMVFVNRNLVEQGLPFHGYQQYAFNVLFSADQVLIDQAGQLKSPTKKALDSLEKLILNKFFLISVVTTMEKEKRFFQKERANLSGNLCAILMGKMGYLNDVLQVLLMELVKDAVARKQHKSLFRRCETITESLLFNWLALTLYPHFKSSSGSPLYLLYMAMQLTMESGPIDAFTYDAKYTLMEDRLLRRWESTKPGETGVQLEAKPLTLKVIIDNGDQVYDCKVMDCDTITQVKAKCLAQIYINYPASQLGVDPSELLLNWHAGHTTHMTLKDEDKTSVREGNLLRHNTLAHYNVRDKANMALVDPKIMDNEDYSNLGDINLDFQDQGAHQDQSRLLKNAGNDEENPEDLYRWHLVKPTEEGAEPTEKSAIDELYLNKLFTTKQSLLQYITALFDHILDSEQCPPPAKYVCDYMDILANTYKIDEQTHNAWKSQSYAARMWGNLIRNPSKLFDVVVPPYVEDSMGVIAQVFEDCVAASSPKFNKDTPGHKLVFHSETTQYRERAKAFHKGLQTMGEQAIELTEFLGELNKFQQQQQSFNKMAYLQKFFDQLGPYMEEIVEGLTQNKEASDLGLDRKMQEVITMMNE